METFVTINTGVYPARRLTREEAVKRQEDCISGAAELEVYVRQLDIEEAARQVALKNAAAEEARIKPEDIKPGAVFTQERSTGTVRKMIVRCASGMYNMLGVDFDNSALFFDEPQSKVRLASWLGRNYVKAA